MTALNLPTVDIVLTTHAIVEDLTTITRTQVDYRTRVDAIAAAVRRAPDPETATTALIIALASQERAA